MGKTKSKLIKWLYCKREPRNQSYWIIFGRLLILCPYFTNLFGAVSKRRLNPSSTANFVGKILTVYEVMSQGVM